MKKKLGTKVRTNKDTGTSLKTIQYYEKNWEKIAHCYELGKDMLPVDPAWYRRKIYQEFLERTCPKSVLDVGCGGGWTVLDALKRRVDARGIEPVASLQQFGKRLLKQNGLKSCRIQQDNLASLAWLSPGSEDCVALLSVLPHVPSNRWDEIHSNIARVLKPGGHYVAAYRNELFDLFTFNSFTMEFYDKSLWGSQPGNDLRRNDGLSMLKSLITNPDIPGKYFTAAQDKTFGRLERVKSNPLTIKKYLQKYGLKVCRVRFYHFHCAPPLLAKRIKDFRGINHQMELELVDDWRGHFMAAMFVVESTRL